MKTSIGIVVLGFMPTGANGGDDEIWAMTLQGGARVIASGECDQAVTPTAR